MEKSLWINGPTLSDLKIMKSVALSDEQNKIMEQIVSPFVNNISEHFYMQRFIKSLTKFIQAVFKSLISRYINNLSNITHRLSKISTKNDHYYVKFVTNIFRRLVCTCQNHLTRYNEINSRLRRP